MKLSINDPVSVFMTRDVVSVQPKTIMTEVAKIFGNHPFHHLPVVDEGVPVGVISRHDYYKLLDSRTLMKLEHYDERNKRWLGSILAEDVMVRNPICLHDHTPKNRTVSLV